MRKLLFLSMMSIVVALVSCKKDESSAGGTSEKVFNISTPQAPTRNTKAPNITRYIMEIYLAGDQNTPIQRIEQASGTFKLPLENNTSYVCLFWADETALNDNATGVFNALDLKNVTLNAGKTMADAFFARLDVVDDQTTFNVTLKRPTAQVNIVEYSNVTVGLPIVITHGHYNNFNALTSDIEGDAVSKSITITPTVTIGTLGSYLTFAPVVGMMKDFTAVYDGVVTNTIPNVPLTANFITNIRGNYAGGSQEFTFIIEIDDVWEEHAAVEGVNINIGGNWIKVADRNASTTGPNGAAEGNSSTDYGSYYLWSNVVSNPDDSAKSYAACYNFGIGGGAWRMMTPAEIYALSGGAGVNTQSNGSRKLQYEDSVWKLYDERVGHEGEFVYFPLSGHFSDTGYGAIDDQGYYWANNNAGYPATSIDALALGGGITSHITNYNMISNNVSFPVRCVQDIN